MSDQFYIEINCQQKYYNNERICGDVFLTKRVQEEGRIIAVLSDGMGHGVKANILGTLTATMALNFTKEHKEIYRTATIIMNTLPVCSERKTSYATFTILDIEHDGKTTILEYDNPQCIILRGSKIIEPEWTCLMLQNKKSADKVLKSCVFYPQKEDRIIILTDGVTQSGMGRPLFPTGWGWENARDYAINVIESNSDISATKLANKIINEAHKNDGFASEDDTSCAVIYFREPRKLMIATGPPSVEEKDEEFANTIHNFIGKKIISGGSTSDIISRQLSIEIEQSTGDEDPELPPMFYMEGYDLCTEGILTLSKVNKILRNYNQSHVLGKGPADQIVRMLFESDEIHFLVGTRINIAHQDPNLPIELEIRRTIVRRIARLLEDKYIKDVRIKYL